LEEEGRGRCLQIGGGLRSLLRSKEKKKKLIIIKIGERSEKEKEGRITHFVERGNCAMHTLHTVGGKIRHKVFGKEKTPIRAPRKEECFPEQVACWEIKDVCKRKIPRRGCDLARTMPESKKKNGRPSGCLQVEKRRATSILSSRSKKQRCGRRKGKRAWVYRVDAEKKKKNSESNDW